MRALRSLPALTLDIDGAPLSIGLARALAAVQVRAHLSLPAQCELTFRDLPPGDDFAPSLRPGSALRVAIPDQETPLFAGEVTAVEQAFGPSGERELRVRGYDRLHRLRKRQTVRAYVEVTALDLARELAGPAGLTVEAAEPGPLFPHLIQHYDSDLELLSAIAWRSGLYLAVRDERLRLLTLAGDGDPTPLRYGENLIEVSIEANADAACRAVSASGWNPYLVEAHTGQATRARSGRDVAIDAPPDQAGGTGERSLLDQPVSDTTQAEALAQAELDWRAASEVVLRGVAEGDPRLQPGAIVDLSGIDAQLAGRFVLASVGHTIDDRAGFVSEISSYPPPPPAPRRSAVVAMGVVTRVDDPEGLARVRVSLPTYGGVETDWLGLLSAGAGAGKGMVAVPDVGDQVLVLFAQGDPARGLVLGGLYGARGAYDTGVEGGAVRRFSLLTPGGQRVTLDDVRSQLRVENGAGSFVDLAADGVRLHAATNLVIEAPGQSLIIRAGSIDFRSA